MAVRVKFRSRYGTRGDVDVQISSPIRVQLRSRYGTRGSEGVFVSIPSNPVRVRGGIRHGIRGKSNVIITKPVITRIRAGIRHDIRGKSGLVISLPVRVRGGIRHDIRGKSNVIISITSRVTGGIQHDIRGLGDVIVSADRVRGGIQHDIRGFDELLVSLPTRVQGGIQHDIRGIQDSPVFIFIPGQAILVLHDIRGSGNLFVEGDDIVIPVEQRSVLVPITILPTIPEVHIVSQSIGWENPGRTIHRSVYTGEEIIVNRGVGRLHGTIQIGELTDEIEARKVEAWLAELVNRSTGCELPLQRTTPSTNFNASINSVEFNRGRIETNISGDIVELTTGHFIRSNHRTLIVTDIITPEKIVLAPSVALPINSTLVSTRTVRVRLRSQDGQYMTPREPDWYGPWNLNWVEIPEDVGSEIPITSA